MTQSKPRISMVAAMSENRVIGIKGGLPWDLPDDRKHFKRLTVGKPLIEGEKTYRAIGRPLPDRINIIMSRNPNLELPYCTVVHSVDEAIAAAGDVPEIMICGGGIIFEEFLPLADRIYLTIVHTTLEGDAFFPEFDVDDWEETERTEHPVDDRHKYAMSFITYDRKKATSEVH